jgi:hypothetical protein
VTICVVLGPKKSSMYSSEYTSGFSRPAALHLAAPPSPRHEGNVGRAPAGCSKVSQRHRPWRVMHETQLVSLVYLVCLVCLVELD